MSHQQIAIKYPEGITMSTLRSIWWSSVAFVGLVSFITMAVTPAALLGAPLVAITQPEHGAVVHGQTWIEVAYRSDTDQPITALELYVDGALVRYEGLSIPKREGKRAFSWDFSFAAATTHTIRAKAIDAEGNEGSASIVVEVQKIFTEAPDQIPPVVNIFYPAQGAQLSGQVEIKANATDNVGVTTVFFYVDGTFKALIMHAPPYATTWDTTKVADGPHVLQAKAWDKAENQAESAEVTVIVQNRSMTTAALGSGRTVASQSAPGPAVATPVPGTTTEVGTAGTVTERQFGTPALPTPKPVSAESTETKVGERHEVAALPPHLRQLPSARSTEPPRIRPSAAPGRVLPGSPPAISPEPRPVASDIVPQIPAAATAMAAQPSLSEWVTASAWPGEFWPAVEAVSHNTRPSDQMVSIGPAPATASLQRVVPPATTDSGPSMWVATSTEMLTLAARPGLSIFTVGAAMRDTIPATSSISWPVPVAGGGVTELAPSATTATEYQVVMIPRPEGRVWPSAERTTTPPEVPAIPAAVAAVRDIQVVFDGEMLELRAAPEANQGISIAPLREIFEHTDGVLYWFPVEKKVHAINDDVDLRLQIGNPQVRVNDQTQTLVLAPYIKQGRTMVPLQFLADTLDVTIQFNPTTGQIVISSNRL